MLSSSCSIVLGPIMGLVTPGCDITQASVNCDNGHPFALASGLRSSMTSKTRSLTLCSRPGLAYRVPWELARPVDIYRSAIHPPGDSRELWQHRRSGPSASTPAQHAGRAGCRVAAHKQNDSNEFFRGPERFNGIARRQRSRYQYNALSPA